MKLPDFLENKENFIPFRTDTLLERMLGDPRLKKGDHQNFLHFKRLLADRFHYEYREMFESIKNDFVSLDPDRETLWEPDFSEEERQEIQIRLYQSVRNLLKICNYNEFTEEQLDVCMKSQPIGGLSIQVDTGDFEEFQVYYRGVRKKSELRSFLYFWSTPWEHVCLSRVFVMARLKEKYGGKVMIKMYKDVPLENIKVIAPKVKIVMPVFARLKVGGSVLGSLFTPLTKLIFAFTLSWIYFFIILGGLLLAAFKGVMSFLSSKTKYLHVFSSSLYYLNISNDLAAIVTLMDAAEEQDLKEAFLGYFILFVNNRALTIDEIDLEAEKWIEEQFKHQLDFEVDDAIRKLKEKDIVFTLPASTPADNDANNEVYKACDLGEVLHRLDEVWDNFNSF